MRREYVDFDIEIKRDTTGYVTAVRDVSSNPVAAPFVMPFEPTELAQFMVAVGPPRQVSRRLVPVGPRVVGVKEYGRRLGDALLSGDVGEAFQRRLASARTQQRDLRLRLMLAEVPELESVPWEYIYSDALGRFLTLSDKTPIVRLIDALDISPPISVAGPLRVLVMNSGPTDRPALAAEREEQLLRATTGDLVASGQLELVVLRDATLSALQRALLEEYHVFHFIGHGGFDPELQEGVLLLEREDGTAHPVSGSRLGTLLHDARGMQLAVLNACEGARTSGRDAFSGVGQALVRQGLPAVVAMQTEISDRAALVFSHEFYWFLTQGLGLEAAISEVRKAMAVSDEASEWGTAVLLRSGTDQPFSFTSSSAQAIDRSYRWDSLYAAAQAALAAGAPETALPIIEQLAAERPDDAQVALLLERVRQTTLEQGQPAAGSSTSEPTTTSSAPDQLESPSDAGGDPGAWSASTNSSPERHPEVPPEHPAGKRWPIQRRSTALVAGGAVLALLLVIVVAWRPGLVPGRHPSTPTVPPPTAGASRIVELVEGQPTGEAVLPYAFSGKLHLPNGTTRALGVDATVWDVLLVSDPAAQVPNAVVSTPKGAALKGPDGRTVADLGVIGRPRASQDGSKFAFVDFNGGDSSGLARYDIVVMDGTGRRVGSLPHPQGEPDPDVVGFVDDAVFYTVNGATLRWDTTTGDARPWRPENMIAFNATTRTGVGMGPTGCFAVLDVNQAAERTIPLDCRGGEPVGISSDGTQAITIADGHDRVFLVPIIAGADQIEFQPPKGHVFEQVAVFSPDRTAVFNVRGAAGDHLVSCRFDGLCNTLTETRPAPDGLTGPPAHVIARD